jgi:metal-dependent hydrolase (beta-lactamase superfamily II)
MALDVDPAAGVVFTHLHADHSTGLEGLQFYARLVPERQLKLLAHPEVSEALWEGHLSAGMKWFLLERGESPSQRGLEDFFQLIALSGTQLVQLGPFTIGCRRTV